MSNKEFEYENPKNENPVKSEKGRISEFLEIVLLVAYLTLVIALIPMFAGFGPLEGFSVDFILTKFMLYVSIGSFFLFGLISIKVAYIITRDNKFRGAVIHDPESAPSFFSFGYLPRIVKNPFLFFIFWYLLAASLFVVAVNQNTFFNGIPVIQQQFGTGGDIFFAIYPASPAETIGAIFFIAIFFLLLNIWTKGKLSDGVYSFLFLIGAPIVSGLYGYLNHILRYGDSEIAKQNVVIFWAFGGFLVSAFGSIIPFLALHDMNNLFVKLNELFGSDKVINYTVGILFLLWILFFILVYFTSNFRKKRKAKNRFK